MERTFLRYFHKYYVAENMKSVLLRSVVCAYHSCYTAPFEFGALLELLHSAKETLPSREIQEASSQIERERKLLAN